MGCRQEEETDWGHGGTVSGARRWPPLRDLMLRAE